MPVAEDDLPQARRIFTRAGESHAGATEG